MTTFSYVRWSSLEQGHSDKSSEDRQSAAIASYARAQNLTIDETLIDSGRSAFTGANLEKGNLGKLTQRILAGAVPSPVLVVEHLDRLSRRPPAEMMSWIVPLLQKGLVVHVAATGQVISIASVNHDIGSFITMMTAAFSAYEFSKKQRERGNAAWKKRRDSASAGHNISRHRARKWLSWNATAKKYDPIPERVTVIEEMFTLRLQGHGKNGIARLFNEKSRTDPKYKPWPSTSRIPSCWTASAIGRIVQDIAVIGYVQYTKSPRGAAKRIPIGEPLKVYPCVIDEEIFARANATRLQDQAKHQGRGKAISNMLGGAVKCAVCGGRATAFGSSRWRVNKDGSESQHYYLYCTNAKQAKTCDNQRGFAYHPMERAALTTLLKAQAYEFPVDTDEADRARGLVLSLEQMAERQERAARNILRVGMEGDDIVADEYQAIKSRLDVTRKELAEAKLALAEIVGRPSPKDYIARVQRLLNRMADDDPETRFEARLEVREAMQALIAIELRPDGQFSITVRDAEISPVR